MIALSSLLFLLLPLVAQASSSQKPEPYKLPKRPLDQIKSLPPPTDAPVPQEPYLYSVSDARIESYLNTYAILLNRSLRHVDTVANPPSENIVLMFKDDDDMHHMQEAGIIHYHPSPGTYAVSRGPALEHDRTQPIPQPTHPHRHRPIDAQPGA